MKVTLNIKDNKPSAFINFIKSLDFIKVEDSEQSIPQWQQDEVTQRLDMIENGEMITRSWDEAKKDIFKK